MKKNCIDLLNIQNQSPYLNHSNNASNSNARKTKMKHFYKTAQFKNTAGNWNQNNARLRQQIERIEPNINWTVVFKKIEPMVASDKLSGIDKCVSRPYHLNYELKRIKSALQTNQTHVGTFRIPITSGRGNKVKQAS